MTIRTDHAPLDYIRAKTDRCKRLEIWALRFTIKPRPGAQQKHVDALSRAPIPVQPDQQPILLDEFPDRVVLLVRSWDEHVAAWSSGEDRQNSSNRGRKRNPFTSLQRFAEKAQAQRRGLMKQHAAKSFLAHTKKTGAAPGEESGEDGCQVLLTDGEESDDADAALVVPEKETDTAALVTGHGGVALPKAFSNTGLVKAQANDPDCLRYSPLVNKPRTQWPPHLAAAPLRFLYVAGVLCAR